MNARYLGLIVLLVGLTLPSAAEGHHPVSESGIAWVEPVSTASVGVTASSFDFGGRFRGDWQTVTPRLEWAFAERWSASVRLPIAHLHFADGRRAIGLADIELSGKYRIVATEHGEFILSGGLGTALPTGDRTVGLGAGHVEFSPFLTLSSQPVSWLIFSGLINERLSLGKPETAVDSQGPHGSILSPHASHELEGRLAATALLGPAYLTTGWDQIVSLTGEMGHLSAARLEVGYAEPGAFRFSAGAKLPLLGQPRYRWQVTAGAALFF
jgi:hypothetical protein